MPTILFDIDGTLIRTGGAGKAAMEAALASAFGIREIRDVVSYSGRTDPAIGYDLLRVHDLEPNPTNYQRLREAYLQHLEPCLRDNVGYVLPGVHQLLHSLQAAGRRIGLLTGNTQAGARAKLDHFGLWSFFTFGGFGDEHHDRDDVAKTALAAARMTHGEPATRDVWVIGDTPLDVQCARAILAKAIAVATGWTSVDELAATGADLVLSDLGDLANLPSYWFQP